jgi:hypothetical protein
LSQAGERGVAQPATAALRIQISDPSLVGDLADFLRGDPQAVVTEIAAGEIEVTLLGSWSDDALAAELDQRVRDWLELRVGVRIAIRPD